VLLVVEKNMEAKVVVDWKGDLVAVVNKEQAKVSFRKMGRVGPFFFHVYFVRFEVNIFAKSNPYRTSRRLGILLCC
jgi:hypothetical protein